MQVRKVNKSVSTQPLKSNTITVASKAPVGLITGTHLDYIRSGIGKELGTGSFGSVASYEVSKGVFVAVKRANKTKDGIDMSLYQEAMILAGLHHPNIIDLLDVGIVNGELFLVLPLAYTSLANFADDPDKRKAIKPADIENITYQCLRGLQYLHANNIVHADVKPGNVLIFRPEGEWSCGITRVVLADMGLSLHYDCYDLHALNTRNIGTPFYRGPELWLGGAVTPASDIWALAMMIGQLLYDDQFFDPASSHLVLLGIFEMFGVPNEKNWPDVATLPEWNDPDTIVTRNQASLKPPTWKPGDDPEEEYLKHSLQLDPLKRYSANALLGEPWFDDLAGELAVCTTYKDYDLQCGTLVLKRLPILTKKDSVSLETRRTFYKMLFHIQADREVNNRTVALAAEFAEHSMKVVLNTNYDEQTLSTFILACLQLASILRERTRLHTRTLVTKANINGFINLQTAIITAIGIPGDIATTYDVLEEALKVYPKEIHQDAFNILRLSYYTQCAIGVSYDDIVDAVISLALLANKMPAQEMDDPETVQNIIDIFRKQIKSIYAISEYTEYISKGDPSPKTVLYRIASMKKYFTSP
jgi:serine/threonine protein kinase